MTGEPVAMRLYRASRPTLMMPLVRLAPGVLMVVLSSIAMNALVTLRKTDAKFRPFGVLNASMFMTKILSVSTALSINSI